MNYLENWDGTADQDSIANGLMLLYNKYVGPGQAVIEFTRNKVIIYRPSGECQLSYSPYLCREIYGRVRHMGISLNELKTIRKVYKS